MGRAIFVNTSTIEFFRTGPSIDDVEITDTLFTNILRKWIIPFNAGTENVLNERTIDRTPIEKPFEDEYLNNNISEFQPDISSGKHMMLTIESSKLVNYTLDPKIEQVSETREVHSSINDNGTDKVTRLGTIEEITNEDCGLEWEQTGLGESELKEGEVLPGFIEVTDLTPFLLFNREHIA